MLQLIRQKKQHIEKMAFCKYNSVKVMLIYNVNLLAVRNLF